MKLISSVNSIDMYKNISSKIDGVVLGTRFSSYSYKSFSDDELLTIINSIHDKEIFLLINVLMHEEMIEELETFITSFLSYPVKFIYQDLGIMNILIKHNVINRGIYNPLTMITNSQDLKMYTQLGVDAVGLSNEIPLIDVINDSEKNSQIFYLGFGYHPMYQTYRQLLSLNSKHKTMEILGENLMLEEQKRPNLKSPIIENKYGTIIFRPGVISCIKEIKKLQKVKYLFIDGIFINENIYEKVVDIYYDAIINSEEKDEYENEFDKLNLPISNNFIYQDSVYDPKEFEK